MRVWITTKKKRTHNKIFERKGETIARKGTNTGNNNLNVHLNMQREKDVNNKDKDNQKKLFCVREEFSVVRSFFELKTFFYPKII